MQLRDRCLRFAVPQEFLANQERLRPQEERNQEDRAKVAPRHPAAPQPVDACGCCCCSACSTGTLLTLVAA